MDLDFTIVTASYNYGHYIEECLNSVSTQNGVTLEHLIMDAGSRDETAEVVSRFPHASFQQEPDNGMSDAINKGFRHAKGRWVMWLNADDRLKPGALAEIKQFAETHGAVDLIYGAWDYIDAGGNFIRRMGLFPFRKRMLIQHGCYIGSTACFYRKATTIDKGFLLDDDFRYCMDGEYYARLALAGKKFVYLPVVLADFRIHDQSISQANLSATGIHGALKLQKQIAEVDAIRRAYGWNFGGSRELTGLADGLLCIAFRLQRGILKKLHEGRWHEPRL